MEKKKLFDFTDFKIIIAVIGVLIMLKGIPSLKSFVKSFTKTHSCKYYLVNQDRIVSCKRKVFFVKEDNLITCEKHFIEENHFWFSESDWNNEKLLKSNLKLDKEFLETCFDK